MRRNARGCRTGKGICVNPEDMIANNGPSNWNNEPGKRRTSKGRQARNQTRQQQKAAEQIQKDMAKKISLLLPAASSIYTVDQTYPVAVTLTAFERFYAILFYNWTHPEEYLLDEHYWSMTHPKERTTCSSTPPPHNASASPPPVLQTPNFPEDIIHPATRQCKYAMLVDKLCIKGGVINHHKHTPTSTTLHVPSRYNDM
ncbi:hypothetical protein TrRE_jg12851, partial [Triparma retinervis]